MPVTHNPTNAAPAARALSVSTPAVPSEDDRDASSEALLPTETAPEGKGVGTAFSNVPPVAKS